MTDTGIQIAGVSHAFGRGEGRTHALDAVSLGIEKGEFVCIIGPSGCGKSTLLAMLAGFVVPTAGTITLAGCSPTTHGLRRSVVFQEYALFPWLTAVRNVEFALESRGMRKGKERRDVALGFLDQVELRDFADSYPHQLSGGMQQRVAIARALAYAPDFLLMDEPLGALDALTRDRLQALIYQLWQEFGPTVVYITHDVSEAVYLADRVVVFTKGPGAVKEIVDVDLPRPRVTADPAYVEMLRRVRGLLTTDASGPEASESSASGRQQR